MKKKYSFIRYIVFSVVFLFVFNFNTKVMADNLSCEYIIDYPVYDWTNGEESISYIHYDYLRYFFKKNFYSNFSNAEDLFGAYIDGVYQSLIDGNIISKNEQASSVEALYLWLNWSDGVNGGDRHLSVDFEVTVNDEMTKYEDYTTDEHAGLTSCPDLIITSFSVKTLLGEPIFTIKNRKYYYLSSHNNDVDAMLKKALLDLGNDAISKSLFFMSNKAKIASGGIMYVNRAYNLYFNETHAEEDIDPIVAKYLKLDGFQEGLNNINSVIDEYFNDSGEVDDTIAENVANLAKKIDDFDTISNDLEILKYFNETNAGNISGLRNILNEFISYYDDSGLKSEAWFNQYMPDSKAKYVDALIMVLDWANKNAPALKRLKELEIYQIEKTKCGEDATCLDKLCREQSDIEAYIHCYSSSVTDSDQAARACYSLYKGDRYFKAFCENKSDEELKETIDNLNEMANEQQDKINIYIEESVYNSIKTTGVEIKKDDELCEVLYGEDGLGVYIFGLLNVIRIGGPILIIILTAYDGIKMIASFKDDENKKFYNRLKIRLICLVILFLVPTLIKFLINLLIPEGTCLEYLKNI